MVAKSLVIGDHCRTVSSLVQDLMSGIRLLLAAAGRAWSNSFRVIALSKIAYLPKQWSRANRLHSISFGSTFVLMW